MKENSQLTVAQEKILGALAQIKDPDLGRDIVTLGFVKDLQISGENVSFTIELTTPGSSCPRANEGECAPRGAFVTWRQERRSQHDLTGACS